MKPSSSALAVLLSGGLDSAILVGEASATSADVVPIYIRTGLVWEASELRFVRNFLTALAMPTVRPLVVLDQPVSDVYGQHWSLTGEGVPDAQSEDQAVYLPGRNVLLLSKALLWCHLHQVPALALGTLAGNPFPDATPAFFASYAQVVNQAIAGRVHVHTPYAKLHKSAVLQRGRGMPLQHTFSCMRPSAGRHCGACNKCAERHKAFRQAQLPDPTDYAQELPCTA